MYKVNELTQEEILIVINRAKAPCSVCMIQNTCEDICKAYYQWRKNERKNDIRKSRWYTIRNR